MSFKDWLLINSVHLATDSDFKSINLHLNTGEVISLEDVDNIICEEDMDVLVLEDKRELMNLDEKDNLIPSERCQVNRKYIPFMNITYIDTEKIGAKV